MNPCKYFEGCSAPICPFDPDHAKRVYLNGEPACMLMSEAMQTGAEARLRSAIGDKLVSEVLSFTKEVLGSYGRSNFTKRLKRAATTNSRLEVRS